MSEQLAKAARLAGEVRSQGTRATMNEIRLAKAIELLVDEIHDLPVSVKRELVANAKRQASELGQLGLRHWD